MSTLAEERYRAAQVRLASAPNDLATLKEFSEAARAAGHRPEALEALKAAYARRKTPEIYGELRMVCTYPEFQAIAKPDAVAGATPATQAGTGAELLPRRAFPLLLDQVIFYPIQDGLSIFILLCCSVMLAISSLLAGAGILGIGASLIVAGFPFAYFWSVVSASGMGEKKTRGWPDVSDPGELSEAFGRWLMVSVICFGPALLPLFIPAYSGDDIEVKHAAGAIALGLLGVCYYPMALMLAGFTHSVGEVFNVPTAIKSIGKMPGDYLVCLGFFVGSYIFVVLVEIGLYVVGKGAPLPLYFAFAFFARVIDTYLVVVQMRTVGLLYYARENDLGWFK